MGWLYFFSEAYWSVLCQFGRPPNHFSYIGKSGRPRARLIRPWSSSCLTVASPKKSKQDSFYRNPSNFKRFILYHELCNITYILPFKRLKTKNIFWKKFYGRHQRHTIRRFQGVMRNWFMTNLHALSKILHLSCHAE